MNNYEEQIRISPRIINNNNRNQNNNNNTTGGSNIPIITYNIRKEMEEYPEDNRA